MTEITSRARRTIAAIGIPAAHRAHKPNQNPGQTLIERYLLGVCPGFSSAATHDATIGWDLRSASRPCPGGRRVRGNRPSAPPRLGVDAVLTNQQVRDVQDRCRRSSPVRHDAEMLIDNGDIPQVGLPHHVQQVAEQRQRSQRRFDTDVCQHAEDLSARQPKPHASSTM